MVDWAFKSMIYQHLSISIQINYLSILHHPKHLHSKLASPPAPPYTLTFKIGISSSTTLNIYIQNWHLLQHHPKHLHSKLASPPAPPYTLTFKIGISSSTTRSRRRSGPYTLPVFSSLDTLRRGPWTSNRCLPRTYTVLM